MQVIKIGFKFVWGEERTLEPALVAMGVLT
jgi:hypothetical protein